MLSDRYGRIIDNIRISVTDYCNFGCIYCNKASSENNKKLSIKQVALITRAARSFGIKKIKLTGGEPLTHPEITGIVKEIVVCDPEIEVSVTTNGYYLKQLAGELYSSGVSRINISLDSLQNDVFCSISGFDGLNEVLGGINETIKYGFKGIKINTVFLDSVNSDEIERIREFAGVSGIDFQLINRMELSDDKSLFEDIARFDRPPICDRCSRLRITSDYKILPCLFSSDEVDISSYATIEEALIYAASIKEYRGNKRNNRSMLTIGG